jgi:starch synthase
LNDDSLRVLFATPECVPFVKTGGLGDVAGALPAALARLGIDVRVLLPGYAAVLKALPAADAIAAIPSSGELPAARILAAKAPGGVPVWILDCPSLYDRPGSPYQDPQGKDWVDNDLRFAQLSRVAALLGSESGLETSGPAPSTEAARWRADVVHCNDWQAGLAPVYLRFKDGRRAASVITIHNLAYQGLFPAHRLPMLQLPPQAFGVDGVEFYGQVSFLKGALACADAITTVSPTYADEICREPLGFGLQGLLTARRSVLHGILNGIDTDVWNPAADPLIAQRYDAARLDLKAHNKRALQKRLGLEVDGRPPLMGIVSRLVEQKGLDLVAQLGELLVQLPAQLAIQGRGDPAVERQLLDLAQRHPGRIAVAVAFDESLAHQIEAGADMYLMPSRFEPCGMNQMYSQRYGTPPIVCATGGLVDSVGDYSAPGLADGSATGFRFASPTAGDLLAAMVRALAAYRDPPTWHRLQRNGMARDFSWASSARQYAALYRRLAERA